MHLRTSILIALLFLSITVSAQWTQAPAFPGPARARSTAFTISGKIYLMGGYAASGQALNDFWEYDTLSGAWAQKADFPGPARYGAASFVVNGSGYVATGANDFGYLDDLWRYDTSNNGWTQVTGLPAFSAQHENQRTEAFAFVVGGKAYLGGGEGFVFGPNSTNNIAFADLWEFDPFSNSWTEKTGFPDFTGRDMAIAATINNKGYVGLGCNVSQTVNHQGFWEYDPATDTWAAKASFPTAFTTDASAFVYNSKLYVLGGVNLNPVALSNQFYQYDPGSDTWTSAGTFSGGAIAGSIAISAGGKVIAGTGFDGNLNPRNGIWTFPSVPAGVSAVEKDLVSIYPNPAAEFISLNAPQELAFVCIYDLRGSQLIRQEGSFRNISITALSAGVYQMKLTFKDGSVGYKRFIKAN